MNRTAITLTCCLFIATVVACEERGVSTPSNNSSSTSSGTHTHANGTVHSNDAHSATDDHAGHDHGHDEVSLGSFMIGEMKVEAAQGHGFVEPGKLCHLVIKLPYNDSGQSIVRAWVGTEDRFKSMVAKGEYAPSHDDYDIHVDAPDMLPPKSEWWVEIEKPDGTKTVGSFPFLTNEQVME